MDLKKKEIKARPSIRIMVCLLVFIAIVLLIGINVEKVRSAETANPDYNNPANWNDANQAKIIEYLKSLPASDSYQGSSHNQILFNEGWASATLGQRQKLFEMLSSSDDKKNLVNALDKENIPKLWDALSTEDSKTKFLKDIEPKKNEITNENAKTAYKESVKLFNSLTNEKRNDFFKDHSNLLGKDKGRNKDGTLSDGDRIAIDNAKGFDNPNIKMNDDGTFNIGKKIWNPENTPIWTKTVEASVSKDGKGYVTYTLEMDSSKSTLVDALDGTNNKKINQYEQLTVKQSDGSEKPIALLSYANNGAKITVSDGAVNGVSGTQISVQKGTENPNILVGNNFFTTGTGKTSGSVVVDDNGNVLQSTMGMSVMPKAYSQTLNDYYDKTQDSAYSGQLNSKYDSLSAMKPEAYFESKNDKPFAIFDGVDVPASLKSEASVKITRETIESTAPILAVPGLTAPPPCSGTGCGCGPAGCPPSTTSAQAGAEKISFELNNINGMDITRSPGQQIGTIQATDSEVMLYNIRQNGVLVGAEKIMNIYDDKIDTLLKGGRWDTGATSVPRPSVDANTPIAIVPSGNTETSKQNTPSTSLGISSGVSSAIEAVAAKDGFASQPKSAPKSNQGIPDTGVTSSSTPIEKASSTNPPVIESIVPDSKLPEGSTAVDIPQGVRVDAFTGEVQGEETGKTEVEAIKTSPTTPTKEENPPNVEPDVQNPTETTPAEKTGTASVNLDGDSIPMTGVTNVGGNPSGGTWKDSKNIYFKSFYDLSKTANSGVEVLGSQAGFDNPNKVVAVKFGAGFCIPCKTLDGEIDGNIGSSDISLARVNTGSQVKLTQDYGITTIPAVVYIKGNNIIGRRVATTDRAVTWNDIKSDIAKYSK